MKMIHIRSPAYNLLKVVIATVVLCSLPPRTGGKAPVEYKRLLTVWCVALMSLFRRLLDPKNFTSLTECSKSIPMKRIGRKFLLLWNCTDAVFLKLLAHLCFTCTSTTVRVLHNLITLALSYLFYFDVSLYFLYFVSFPVRFIDVCFLISFCLFSWSGYQFSFFKCFFMFSRCFYSILRSCLRTTATTYATTNDSDNDMLTVIVILIMKITIVIIITI